MLRYARTNTKYDIGPPRSPAATPPSPEDREFAKGGLAMII